MSARSVRELDFVVNRALDNLAQAHKAVTVGTGYDPEKYSSTYSEAADLIRRLRGMISEKSFINAAPGPEKGSPEHSEDMPPSAAPSSFDKEGEDAIERIRLGLLPPSCVTNEQNIYPASFMRWLENWWQCGDEWREEQRKLFGFEFAPYMRGVADMLEQDETMFKGAKMAAPADLSSSTSNPNAEARLREELRRLRQWFADRDDRSGHKAQIIYIDGVLNIVDSLSARTNVETGWLIENGESGADLRYRYYDATGPRWTEDPNKAIRFARRADAEQAAEGDDAAWRIAEHQWG